MAAPSGYLEQYMSNGSAYLEQYMSNGSGYLEQYMSNGSAKRQPSATVHEQWQQWQRQAATFLRGRGCDTSVT